jgi:AcrR family transcriptional regulator
VGDPLKLSDERVAPAIVSQILVDAERCLEHYGLHRATMGHIAKAAGVRRQALYEHFSSRDELVITVMAKKARRIFARAAEAMAAEDGLDAKMVAGLLGIVEDGLAEPYLFMLVSPGEVNTFARIVGADRVMPRLVGEFWLPVLEQAKESGELRATLELEEIVRWIGYVMLILISGRAQGVSDEATDRRLIEEMLLPALTRPDKS